MSKWWDRFRVEVGPEEAAARDAIMTADSEARAEVKRDGISSRTPDDFEALNIDVWNARERDREVNGVEPQMRAWASSLADDGLVSAREDAVRLKRFWPLCGHAAVVRSCDQLRVINRELDRRGIEHEDTGHVHYPEGNGR